MARPEFITSPANPLLKEVRRAVARGSLTSDGLMVAESFHLLEEALRSDLDVRVILAAAGVRGTIENHVKGLRGVRLLVVRDALLEQAGGVETAQGVVALVRPPDWKLEQLFRGTALAVALDGVQDPGNAGAIARAAEAFGASGLLFLKGAVSPYNGKTLRASAGSLFRVPFVAGVDAEVALAAFRQRKLRVYAADPRGETALGRADLRSPSAVVIGSEGRGVSDALRQGSHSVRIATRGVESLNAAVAAGVILYESWRQRVRA